jgi:O-antigen/teichoic acid export membrane protein
VRTVVETGVGPSLASRLSHRKNMVLAVVDQGCSSLTNLGLNLAVASTSSQEIYGALGLVLSLYLLEFGVIYGGIVEPYAVASRDTRERAAQPAIAASLAVGLALGGLHLVAGGLLSGDLATLLTAYAIATPGLLLQAAARGLLISNGKTQVTLRSNILWAAVQVPLTVLAVRTGASTGLFLAWAAGGWASGGYCLWHLGARPRLRGWRSWFHGRLRLAASWTGDQLAQNGLSQVMVFSLGAVAGLSAVGAYRGALQFTGPATVLVSGLRLFVLPGAARRAKARDGSLRPAITRLTVAFPIMTFVLVGPFLLLPDELGERMLGETWAGARAVLPWVLVMRMASTVTTALSVGMRATQDYRATLSLRVASGLVTIVAATVAGALTGVSGATVAMAVVTVASIPAWQRSFNRRVLP